VLSSQLTWAYDIINRLFITSEQIDIPSVVDTGPIVYRGEVAYPRGREFHGAPAVYTRADSQSFYCTTGCCTTQLTFHPPARDVRRRRVFFPYILTLRTGQIRVNIYILYTYNAAYLYTYKHKYKYSKRMVVDDDHDDDENRLWAGNGQ